MNYPSSVFICFDKTVNGEKQKNRQEVLNANNNKENLNLVL